MNVNRIAALTVTTAFVVAVGMGLYLAGSPAEQRLLDFDKQRLMHLAQIRNSVGTYWHTNRALPARINEDVIGIAMSRVPRDPETGVEYEYNVTSDDAYSLCAEFSRASPESMAGEFWAHGSGRYCYDFQVTEHEAENQIM